jgi:hypothetical protein
MNFESWDSINKTWYSPAGSPLTYLGNTGNLIDWHNIIASIDTLPGKKVDLINWNNPLFLKIKEMFQSSNYNMSSAEWINYYPGKDFSENVNQLFGNFVNHPNVIRSWISKVNPGKTAPWHWDVDDDEEKYLTNGKLVRFSCKIGSSDPAHITVVGDQVLYDNQSGDVYQWPDHRTWHGSANAGLIPKYQFNYLAYI